MKLLQNRVLKTAISTQLGGSLMIVIEALPQFPFLSNFNEKSLGKGKNELPFPFLSSALDIEAICSRSTNSF